MAKQQSKKITELAQRAKREAEAMELVANMVDEIPRWCILSTDGIIKDLKLEDISSHVIGSVLRAKGFVNLSKSVWFIPTAREEVD